MKYPSVRPYFFTIVLCSIYLFTGAQKSEPYKCLNNSELAPDTSSAFIDRMTYDDRSNLLYLVSNDAGRLYIDLMITDRATIQKIKMFGFTTWINSQGKQKKTQGIEFPLPADEPEMMMHRREQQADQQDRHSGMLKESLENKNRQMILLGFDGKGSRDTLYLPADSTFSGNMSFPAKEKLLISMYFPLDKLGLSYGSDKTFSIGFESGYLDLNKQGMGMPAGGADRQTGDHPMGGPPGGHDQGDAFSGGQKEQPNINQLARPTRLWIKEVVLSPK